jgi:hypothetical protein
MFAQSFNGKSALLIIVYGLIAYETDDYNMKLIKVIL